MSADFSHACFLRGAGKTHLVTRLVVHHEVACLPDALAIVHGTGINIGDGPYTLVIQEGTGRTPVEGLDASQWYVTQATRLPSASSQSEERWLLKLGVVKGQHLAMRALVMQTSSAQEVLAEVCVARAKLKVAWSGEAFAHKVPPVISLHESIEDFLRRFARSINCWHVYSGKAGMRFSQQGLASLEAGQAAQAMPVSTMTKTAAPAQLQAFWSSGITAPQNNEAADTPYAHEFVQAPAVEMPDAFAAWRRSPEWVVHHGLSNDVNCFALRAGKPVLASSQRALAVIHVWKSSGTGADPSLPEMLQDLIPGLRPEDLLRSLTRGASYAALTLSVEGAAEIRYLEGLLLLEHHNLRDAADALFRKLCAASVQRPRAMPNNVAGLMHATVTGEDGNPVGAYSETDYAALPASGEPAVRSAMVKIRFDWHPQAVSVPYASPWDGAGGTIFFPPRAGDRVLVQFINGDLSAPVVVAPAPGQKSSVPGAFRSPGHPMHARQPQGISARDGLVLETTESGDLVLYAQKGNLVLRARDHVVLQGRQLNESFARNTNSGHIYNSGGE